MGNREIHAILLAAGSSERMADRDKLLLDWHGRPLICHVVHQLVQAPVSFLTIVIRSHSDISSLLPKYPKMQIIENSNAELGMGSSLQLGLSQVNPDVSGLMICLADMPLLATADYSHFLKKFLALESSQPRILIPTFDGIRGHPILFSNKLLPQLLALPPTRDSGAKDLIHNSNEWITELPVETNAVLVDIDHWDDYITHHS